MNLDFNSRSFDSLLSRWSLPAGVIVLGLVFLYIMVRIAVSGGNSSLILTATGGSVGILWMITFGVSFFRFIILLFPLLILAPGVRVFDNLPVIFGDELLIGVFGFILFIGFVTKMRVLRNPPLHRIGIVIASFIPLIVISMVIGFVGFDITPSKGDLFEFVKFGKYALAFGVASYLLPSRIQVRAFVLVLIAVAFTTAVISLIQIMDIAGTRSFFADTFFAAFDPKGSESANVNTLSALNNRAAGTIGNPNELGLMLATVFVVGLAGILHGLYKGRWFIAVASANATIAMALLSTGSRTSLLAVGLGSAYLLYRYLQKSHSGAESTGRTAGLIGIAAVILILGVGIGASVTDHDLPVVGSNMNSRLQRITDFDLGSTSILARTDNIRPSIDQAKSSPIFGYGPAEAESDLLNSRDLDNEFLLILLRFGLAGIAVVILLWVFSFRLGRSLSKSGVREFSAYGEGMIAMIIVNLIAMLTASAIFDIRRMTLIAILLGFAAAIDMTRQNSDSAK